MSAYPFYEPPADPPIVPVPITVDRDLMEAVAAEYGLEVEFSSEHAHIVLDFEGVPVEFVAALEAAS